MSARASTGTGWRHRVPSDWLTRSYRLIAVLVLLAGTTASAVYTRQWQQSLDRADRERAARGVSEKVAGLRSGLNNYERALGAQRALYAASNGNVSYAQFRDFAAALRLDENYPGMQGIGFQQQVAGADIDEFVAQNRAQGRPDFAIQPPGVRPSYYVVKYNEPQSRMGNSWGFDAASNPTVRPHLDRARDTGLLTLSGKAVLGPDLALPKEQQPVAFGMFLPIYRAGAPINNVEERRTAFLGWASSPFRAQDFVNSHFPAGSGMGVELRDGSGTDSLIASSPAGFRPIGPDIHSASLEVGGQTWLLRISAPRTDAVHARFGPRLLLVIGIATSLLLAGVVWLFGAIARQRSSTARLLSRRLAERKTMEADLQRSESTFRRAFDDALVGMVLTGADGRFVRVNAVFAKMLGRSVEALVGTALSEVTHPDDVSLSSDIVRRALAGEQEGWRARKRYLRADGTVVHVELSTVLLREADGTPLHFATQTIDVTARELALVERDTHLRMLNSVIASSQSLIYVKDLEGRYLLANAPFEEAFSVTEAELLGKDDTYLDPILAPVWRLNDLKAQEGLHRIEEWSDAADGRHYYDSVKLPLYDGAGRLYAICGISLDVTQSRLAAEAMRTARDAALAATAAKSEFLATMSHEIRTPMNAVIGLTGLLLDTALDEHQRRLVDTVRTSGDALLAVINNILDFSRIEAGELRIDAHPFNLRDCVDDSLKLAAGATVGPELVVHVADDCPQVLVGDPNRLRQVLVNLIGNALKFTDSGDVRVTVTASSPQLATTDTVAVRFAVRDTGIGIPAERLDRLFKSFSQVDASTTRVYGGSGLGLAISQAIVRAMGGEISVDSTEGVGSTFSFTLPLARGGDVVADGAPVPTQSLSIGSGGRPEQLQVLIAEDNEVNQLVSLLMLQKLGHRADVAANGQEALEAVQRTAYDVVLMDIHMPVMDGLAATRAIRALPAGELPTQPRIVAMTASALDADRHAGAQAGMDGYILKPVRLEELLRVLVPGSQSLSAAPADAAPADTAPTSHAVDLDVLAAMTAHMGAGAPALRQTLIDTYIKQAKMWLGEITTATASSDTDTVWRASHALQSSSAMLGAERLAQMLRELGQVAKDATGPMELLALAVEQEYARVAEALAAAGNPASLVAASVE